MGSKTVQQTTLPEPTPEERRLQKMALNFLTEKIIKKDFNIQQRRIPVDPKARDRYFALKGWTV